MLNHYTKPMPLERPVYESVPVTQSTKRVPDLFGVEVEVEGAGKLSPLDPVWTVKEDGSLRANNPGDFAKEFVFAHPLPLADTIKAVELLMSYLTEGNRKVYESERASIHVHMNFAAETARVVYNFITLALIYDELFVSLHAHHRAGNNFCLRAKDAAGQVVRLIASVQGGHGFNNLGSEERYSSINFVSLLKFGTVEFRSMETNTDIRRIIGWIRLIRALKLASRTYKNPVEIISEFSRLGPNQFLMKTMPTTWGLLMKDDYSAMLQRGVRIAQDFAYCSAWNEGAEEESPQKGKAQPKKPVKGAEWILPPDTFGAAPGGPFKHYFNTAAQPMAPLHKYIVGLQGTAILNPQWVEAQDQPQPMYAPDEPDFDEDLLDDDDSDHDFH